MSLKIKWNDDRVRGAINALLLLTRERLARGQSDDPLAAALAEFRADPQGFKVKKATWPPTQSAGELTQPAQVAYYQALLKEADRLSKKMEQSKIQFNSLRELDNWLLASLGKLR